jgi:oligopeptide/dipeptide ABC transporter ATP-binding protein
MPLLKIENLQIEVKTAQGPALAVRGVGLEMEQGQVLGLVGESGCGKTLTALAIPGLLPSGARRVQGRVLWQGRDLAALDEEGLRAVRGRDVAMIFQDPSTCLNPVLCIGGQVAEAAREHQGLSQPASLALAVDLLAQVGVPEPALRARQYPHQFSGGMRQRAMIAMALACGPKLLIADEPTTALDVTVQAQILELLMRLKRERALSILLITHDLSLVAQAADQLAVMYAGCVVEQGPARALLQAPAHPYTQALLACLPQAGRALKPLQGQVPELSCMPAGCAFAPRCAFALPKCRAEQPRLSPLEPFAGHAAACLRLGELAHAS